MYEMLGVINLSEICNLEDIKVNNRWLNTVFTEYIQKPDYFAFDFITDSVHIKLFFFAAEL